MNKIYLVQMEEIVVNEDSAETVQTWENFYEYTFDLEEAKRNANELLEKIRNHETPEVFEVDNANNDIGVCIAVYNEKDYSILDVIDIGALTPNEWNIKCGDCGSYCSEGTCFKYGDRVNEDGIANDCWHKL